MEDDLFGIVMDYNPLDNLEKININELSIGDYVEGKPDIKITPRTTSKGSAYNRIDITLINEAAGEYCTLYINCPEADMQGIVHHIMRGSDFQRGIFDLIFSFKYLQDPSSVMWEEGREMNMVSMFKLKPFVNFLNNKEWLQFKITEGNLNSKYNSQVLTKIE